MPALYWVGCCKTCSIFCCDSCTRLEQSIVQVYLKYYFWTDNCDIIRVRGGSIFVVFVDSPPPRIEILGENRRIYENKQQQITTIHENWPPSRIKWIHGTYHENKHLQNDWLTRLHSVSESMTEIILIILTWLKHSI